MSASDGARSGGKAGLVAEDGRVGGGGLEGGDGEGGGHVGGGLGEGGEQGLVEEAAPCYSLVFSSVLR